MKGVVVGGVAHAVRMGGGLFPYAGGEAWVETRMSNNKRDWDDESSVDWLTIELTCRYGAQRHGGQVERLVRPWVCPRHLLIKYSATA